jgi:hypothetical protein
MQETVINDTIDPDAALTERQFRRKMESYAAERDLYKHITTLSTGSIVLMTAFLDRLFAHPDWSWLAGLAFGGFTVSVLGSVIMHVLSTIHTDSEAELDAMMPSAWVGGLLITVAFGGFVVGVCSLAAFAARNLP